MRELWHLIAHDLWVQGTFTAFGLALFYLGAYLARRQATARAAVEKHLSSFAASTPRPIDSTLAIVQSANEQSRIAIESMSRSMFRAIDMSEGAIGLMTKATALAARARSFEPAWRSVAASTTNADVDVEAAPVGTGG